MAETCFQVSSLPWLLQFLLRTITINCLLQSTTWKNTTIKRNHVSEIHYTLQCLLQCLKTSNATAAAHPKYEFKYGVKDPHTHDIKEQAEKRDGHKVESHYMLVEPDGTIRTVQYTADKHTGFHAHVQRSGHAVHPTH
ncbi:cuticle protein 19-like isoform X4 [Periplaneta americana]|uniref:cuticle protein 19-like isoform X4 n=1 Tax=Periplaneta americana TaxID=6978 RepID=UPI0037E84C84